MRPIRALYLAAILASGACAQDPTLEITVYDRGGSQRWPPGQDTVRVQIVSGLDDPKGLAGLELGIGGALPRRVFKATDLAGENPPFVVPGEGVATVTVRLVQDGQVVAGGAEEWTLEPEVEWNLDVARVPWPPSEEVGGHIDLENPECSWFWCHRNWRFPIVDEAANYEDEALWVTLYRAHPDECADLCGGWW